MPIDGTLIKQWSVFFEANPAAAAVCRDEIQRLGRPTDPEGQAKQLGLSVALTDPEFRCEHYGDFRICPHCTAPDRRRTRDELIEENKRLEGENAKLETEVQALLKRLGGAARGD